MTTQAVAALASHARTELRKVISGQQEPLDQILLTVLAGGHALIEGVPGIAKTLSVKALARVFDLTFNRVQCTVDLMPADVIGANVFNVAAGTFTLRPGPVFTDLLLVDEINRTPPRTQAALLEAMEERQVTIDGNRHPLSSFFTTFATQNPIEFEGTYPLPEAQLDRFMLKIRMSYPAREEEADVLKRWHEGFDARDLDKVGIVPLEAGLLAAARREVTSVAVEPALFHYVTDIVRRTREWPAVSLGASPRAAVNLLTVSKAVAAMEGRAYLIPDDVKSAALPALRHRLILKPEADLEGLTTDQVVSDVMGVIEVPK